MPSGHWADVQAAPNSGFAEGLICSHLSPAGVVGAAIADEFSDKPIALRHLLWYLGAGGGADLVEDANLESMLRTDSGVQALLNARIPTGRTSGTASAHFKIEQNDYVNQDFRFAFGAIDRLEFGPISPPEPCTSGFRTAMNGTLSTPSIPLWPATPSARRTVSMPRSWN
jgi:hypothetical protein